MRLIVGLVLMLAGGVAHADQHAFAGLHPIAKGAGGGICEIEGPHVHAYAVDALQYRVVEGLQVFVGDPVAFGYAGPRYQYKGHHPVHIGLIAGGIDTLAYCYLDGPHFHAFAPPEGELSLVGDTYFFVGDPPRLYLEERPRLIKINAVYASISYPRPVVAVTAPVGWIGAHIEITAPAISVPAVEAQVTAKRPVVSGGIGIGIAVPAPPSVRVRIGGSVTVPVVKKKKRKRHF
jgi:hypothetical protein